MINCPLLANSIVTSDLHLSDQKHAEYRWRIFADLRELVRVKEAKTVYILGDLTNEKDHHSASFVHDVWRGVWLLAMKCEVVILKGNHDYRTGPPFFQWLGVIPNVRYHHEIWQRNGHLFLPHTRMPSKDWSHLRFELYDCIMMHETANRSIVSNGHRVPGIEPNLGVKEDCLVLSGDVHVPQQVGDIVYVGSPYHVHFGDRFLPRVLHFNSEGVGLDVHLDFPERFVANIETVADLDSLSVRPRDMVKVRIQAPAAAIDFRSMRDGIMEWAEEAEVLVQGMEIVPSRHPVRRRVPGAAPNGVDDAQTGRTRGRSEPVVSVRAYGEACEADDATIAHGIRLLQEAKG